MRQTTKYLGLDIAGVTDEPSLIANYVTNMVAIDEAIHNAEGGGGGEAVDQVARNAAAAAQATAQSAAQTAEASAFSVSDETTMISQNQTNWGTYGTWLSFGPATAKTNIALIAIMSETQQTLTASTEVATLNASVNLSPVPTLLPLVLVDESNAIVDLPKGLMGSFVEHSQSDYSTIEIGPVNSQSPITIEPNQAFYFLAIYKES